MNEPAAWSGRAIVQQVVAQILPLLPDDLKGILPTVEEVEAELARARTKEMSVLEGEGLMSKYFSRLY